MTGWRVGFFLLPVIYFVMGLVGRYSYWYMIIVTGLSFFGTYTRKHLNASPANIRKNYRTGK